MAHWERNFPKVKTSKIFPGQNLTPCQISKESVNHKDFYKHFNNFLILKEDFWDESGRAMVRDRLMVSSAKMMLMNSSFTMSNKMSNFFRWLRVKNCFKMALTDPGPTQIGLWAAIWEIAKNIDFLGRIITKNWENWVIEIGPQKFLIGPRLGPPLIYMIILLKKKEPFWSKLQKVMKLKMKNGKERKFWE